MLALHELTLFWFDFSSEKEQSSGLVKEWVVNVQSAKRQVASKVRLRSKHATTLDAGSDLSATLAGTSAVSKGSKVSKSAVNKAVHEDVGESLGLEQLELDNDEEERFVAITSPVKGNKRLTSTVCCHFLAKCCADASLGHS